MRITDRITVINERIKKVKLELRNGTKIFVIDNDLTVVFSYILEARQANHERSQK